MQEINSDSGSEISAINKRCKGDKSKKGVKNKDVEEQVTYLW